MTCEKLQEKGYMALHGNLVSASTAKLAKTSDSSIQTKIRHIATCQKVCFNTKYLAILSPNTQEPKSGCSLMQRGKMYPTLL